MSTASSAYFDARMPDLLSALKACLDENGIASVKVTIDAQSYVMEGAS
jgi:hypothetical protein